MIKTKEAIARIALAELEARNLKKRLENRARRWRIAMTAVRAVVALALGIYLLAGHWQISGTQACGLFFIFFASAAWQEHQMSETIRGLETELERLKERIEAKSA